MSRKSKRRLLFGIKVLAICGAAVFTVKGIDNLFADARGNTRKKEDAERIIEVCEITTTDIAAEMQPEEKEKVQEADAPEESQGMIVSMDWDSEDAYLLAKIAMAEAEGEDTEGKALVMLVVLNRTWSDFFPDGIEDVIMENNGTTYQFSPAAPRGRLWKVEPNQDCWDALELIESGWDESQGALYFESQGKSSWHRNNLQFLFQHGNHYFYTNKPEYKPE